MQTRLSQRLLSVANYVPKHSRLLDVGSDHAYLPLYLVEQGIIDFAVAGEVAKGPFDISAANVAASDFSDKIEVRFADGLSAMEAGDAISCITICGMGGALIAQILSAGRDQLANVDLLILQPNNREDELRDWLSKHGFSLVSESIMTEHDKFYEILIVTSGQMTLSQKDLRFGLYLRREKSPVFYAKWQREQEKLEQALLRIPKDHIKEAQVLHQKINAIKEVLDES